MQRRVAVVEQHQQLVGVVGVRGQKLRLHPLARREQPGLAAGRVNGVKAPVFVAVGVLQVDQQPRGQPAIAHNAAAAVGGQAAALAGFQVFKPKILDPFPGRNEGKLLSIGGNLNLTQLWVAEQNLQRDFLYGHTPV